MRGIVNRNRIIALFRAITNPFAAHQTVFDGDAVMAACDLNGVLYTRLVTGGTGGIGFLPTGVVTAFSDPGAGVVASASLPADGSGSGAKNVATMITYKYGDTAIGAVKTLVVRDGASGVGTILWQQTVGPILANTQVSDQILFPNGLPGLTATTAMTVEFTAAPAGTGFQSVSIQGYLAK